MLNRLISCKELGYYFIGKKLIEKIKSYKIFVNTCDLCYERVQTKKHLIYNFLKSFKQIACSKTY